ncbi:MAG: hypothetical protein SNF33_03375 [Candidatus Algichlamydia australiensis]|nr:hypothetical protein [Chlamydiales bacterium]
MTQEQNINIREVSGSAANVLSVVAQTMSKINQFNMKANDVLVGLGSSTLLMSLVGGLAALTGEVVGAGFQLVEGGLNLRKGYHNKQNTAAVEELKSRTNASLDVEQGMQNQAHTELQDLKGGKVQDGPIGEDGQPLNPEVHSESKKADVRSELDMRKSRIDTINSQNAVEKEQINSTFKEADSQLTGYINMAQAASMASKALGSFMNSFKQSQTGLLQGMQQAGQKAYEGVNSTLAQLQSSSSQLYAGLGLRG